MHRDSYYPNTIMEGTTLTVTQLNLMIARLLEQNLVKVRIRGEISNFSCAASGHWYFSLKDEQAQIRCVMFRGRNQLANFFPKDGQAIAINGMVSLYGPKGELQINAETLEPIGTGNLFLAFQQLKEALAKAGLFDRERKRPLPLYPRTVGIITSLQAAALADILTVFARRAPYLSICIYPAPVQGNEAAQKLAMMLDEANRRAEVDVVLLCRGGGSIEDLWAFNEEVLAQAIARSTLPIVVGVGHETDFTIADFVADVRAPTPSAAAELISKHYDELLHRIGTQHQRLRRCLLRYFELQTQRLDNLICRLPYPRDQLIAHQKILAHMIRRLNYEMKTRLLQAQTHLQEKRIYLAHASPRSNQLTEALKHTRVRFQQAHRRLFTQAYNRWQVAKRELLCLDPERTLARGYAVLFNQHGEVVRHPEQLAVAVPMQLQLAKGSVQLELSKIDIKNKSDKQLDLNENSML